MKFIWTPEYSVGVKTFDEQHRHFFELADKISGLAEAAEVSRESLLTSITEFGDYSLYHLSNEEEYFAKYGYPDACAHIAAHDIYRAQIGEYLDKARDSFSDKALIARELSEFAAHWLIKHIMEIDKRYADFFKSKGVN